MIFHKEHVNMVVILVCLSIYLSPWRCSYWKVETVTKWNEKGISFCSTDNYTPPSPINCHSLTDTSFKKYKEKLVEKVNVRLTFLYWFYNKMWGKCRIYLSFIVKTKGGNYRGTDRRVKELSIKPFHVQFWLNVGTIRIHLLVFFSGFFSSSFTCFGNTVSFRS